MWQEFEEAGVSCLDWLTVVIRGDVQIRTVYVGATQAKLGMVWYAMVWYAMESLLIFIDNLVTLFLPQFFKQLKPIILQLWSLA